MVLRLARTAQRLVLFAAARILPKQQDIDGLAGVGVDDGILRGP